MGLLDGGLQGIFGAAFGVVYLSGFLCVQDREEAEDGGFTTYERRTGIKYQPDTVTEAMRLNGGYTERDARFLVLQIDQHGCAIGRPNTDAQLLLDGVRWAVADCEADPANTHWAVRASPA